MFAVVLPSGNFMVISSGASTDCNHLYACFSDCAILAFHALILACRSVYCACLRHLANIFSHCSTLELLMPFSKCDFCSVLILGKTFFKLRHVLWLCVPWCAVRCNSFTRPNASASLREWRLSECASFCLGYTHCF